MELKHRTERDSMGEVLVPSGAYYGASTQRAIHNFPISGLRMPRSFIRALALIKAFAAQVNCENGDLDAQVASAVIRAALETAGGAFDCHFVVDVFQTGSGTSTNMNANEVIANRAIELLGGERGDRSLVHPNDHVNKGMSSNDAIPTATHVAAVTEVTGDLLPALRSLARALDRKSEEFTGVIKTGRTHLNDATPVTLGQEFSGYASQIYRAIERIEDAADRLQEVALGGTAVGTGINTRADFAGRVLAKLSRHVGIEFRQSSNHFQAQSCLDDAANLSGALRVLALALTKIANDIRWMASGPRAGLAELELPEVQPGSSIMPGKVNPVIAESVCQVAVQVIGNDAAIAAAGQGANFELITMQPVVAHNLLQSISILARAADNFRRLCIDGLKATEAGPRSVEKGLALATALVPALGYDEAARLAKIAAATGKTIREVARGNTSLSDAQLNKLLDPFAMIGPEAPPSDTSGSGLPAAPQDDDPDQSGPSSPATSDFPPGSGTDQPDSPQVGVEDEQIDQQIAVWEDEGGNPAPAEHDANSAGSGAAPPDGSPSAVADQQIDQQIAVWEDEGGHPGPAEHAANPAGSGAEPPDGSPSAVADQQTDQQIAVWEDEGGHAGSWDQAVLSGRCSPDTDALAEEPVSIDLSPLAGAGQYVLGITGGIACGKTTVASILEDFAVPVIDTDHLGHELLSGDNPTSKAVLCRFGADVAAADGGIDRQALSRRVFGDAASLDALNRIMHPAILRLLRCRVAALSQHSIVAVLIPLLHENNLAGLFDETWAVTVPDDVQLLRLKQRNRLTTEEAMARIEAQLPQAVKAARSQQEIDNGGTLDATRAQVSICLAYSYSRAALSRAAR